MNAKTKKIKAEAAKHDASQVHFLHIGKAAGTQVRYLTNILNKTQSRWSFVKHDHHTNLRDLPRKAPFFFSIRLPHTRFFSGFYSRKRKGQPRLLVNWKANEVPAFETFEHANDLAEALFSGGARGQAAFDAINAITHTAKPQVAWFEKCGYFLDQRPPLGIIRQEHMDADWARFMIALQVTDPPLPTRDEKRAHSNNYDDIPPLSPKAVDNLNRWYVQDVEFYKRCEDWINQQDT